MNLLQKTLEGLTILAIILCAIFVLQIKVDDSVDFQGLDKKIMETIEKSWNIKVDGVDMNTINVGSGEVAVDFTSENEIQKYQFPLSTLSDKDQMIVQQLPYMVLKTNPIFTVGLILFKIGFACFLSLVPITIISDSRKEKKKRQTNDMLPKGSGSRLAKSE